VVWNKDASFDVRFDFHTVILLMYFDVKVERRYILGFEAEERRSLVHARTRDENLHAAEIFMLANSRA